MALNCSGGTTLLPLCAIPAKMSRDGYAGANANIYIPFYGYYFFSGEQMTFPEASVPQSNARFIGGNVIPGVFSKYGCDAPCGCS